jgi:uncharacterized protein (DUF2267 family)
MKYNEFVGQVQLRARLSSLDEAVGAVRATLTVLGQRLSGGEASDLAPPACARDRSPLA